MKELIPIPNMDRISDLPDPIVHHIMSFLTNPDVIKLSILSKRFFFLWSSFPVIEFDDKDFARCQSYPGRRFRSVTNAFLDHIINSILLRRFDTTVLHEFKVTAHLGKIPATDNRLGLAISMAIANGVKSIDLDLGFSRYVLPADFASKSINVLRFKGCRIDLCNVIQCCPSLRIVSLTSCKILQDIKISSQTLTEFDLCRSGVRVIQITAPNLTSFSFRSKCSRRDQPKPCVINISECQNITYLALNNVVNGNHWIEAHARALDKLKTFILNRCQDIERITIRNDNLETVEICYCPLLASVKLIAHSLESFVFKGTENKVCSISFIASDYIKDLSIENAAFTDEWLEAQMSMLGCLETLRLDRCNLLKKIRIFHEKLRILELLGCSLVEADIDTPQLVSFVYEGGVFEFEKIVTRSYCTATLAMKPWMTYNNEKFYGWWKLLSYFSHCKSLKVICSSPEEMMMPEHLRERLVSPLYDLENLEIHINSLEKIDINLIDSLLWLSPLLNNLQISTGHYSQVQMIIKFAYKDMNEAEEDEESFCCIHKPVKCWRHYLSSVEIHSRDVSQKNGLEELQKYFPAKAKILNSL